jgi:hypothetical protein
MKRPSVWNGRAISLLLKDGWVAEPGLASHEISSIEARINPASASIHKRKLFPVDTGRVYSQPQEASTQVIVTIIQPLPGIPRLPLLCRREISSVCGYSHTGGVAILRGGLKKGSFVTVTVTLCRTASTVSSIWR